MDQNGLSLVSFIKRKVISKFLKKDTEPSIPVVSKNPNQAGAVLLINSPEDGMRFESYMQGERERAVLAVLGELGHIPVTPQLRDITDGVLSEDVRKICQKVKQGDIIGFNDPRYNAGLMDGIKNVMVVLGFRNVKNHMGNIITEVPPFVKQEMEVFLGGACININWGDATRH